ncbi:MAG: endolytic transglycosylase MltG [Candidatus Pacebacteria bacterium]|nr:endolytic transglycosylase MltG [Candidatus Paceibacterota bacterium]
MIIKSRHIILNIFLIFACILPEVIFATVDDDFKKAESLGNFVVVIGETDDSIVSKLYEKKFIKNEKFFNLILDIAKLHGKIKPGGYKINANMNELQIIKVLISDPYMRWIVIPEGFRKEEIAELISKEFKWNEKQKAEWLYEITESREDYVEGVYFPDTYLFPSNETGQQIAQRMINRFNEKFSDYSQKFVNKNIKWTTALKIASLVQRESASKDDMPIIAGIIWNRLEKDMKLDIDATVQYIRDSRQHTNASLCKVKDSIIWKNNLCFQSNILDYPFLYISSGDWWKTITVEDKKIDSSYNTYIYKGLPSYPISNPGISAIDATLNPAETKCIFYLHDNNKKIHCAETYEEHLKNINDYLK